MKKTVSLSLAVSFLLLSSLTMLIAFYFLLSLAHSHAFHTSSIPRQGGGRLCKLSAEMEYTQLGQSELKVSKVCLGSMTWGEQNTLEEGVEQLDYAFSRGVNFVDTAEMYPVPARPETQGRTDLAIAKWLRKVDRSKVILASKVAGASERLTWLPGREGQATRLTPQQLSLSVERSLARLQTPYLDLLQLHWPDRYVSLFGAPPFDPSLCREAVPFEEQLLALSRLVDRGLVRYIGLSNETPYGVMRFLQAAKELKLPQGRVVSLQNSYSLLVRGDFETSLLEVCHEEKVSLLPYSPLAGGVLTGKYISADSPPGARLNLFVGYMARYKQSLSSLAVQEYANVASKHGLSPTDLSLAWIYSRPHVASTIIGATSLAQLRENLDAFDKRPLITSEVLKDINEVYKRYRDPSSAM